MPDERDVRELIAGLSPVGKLVHLAYRMDAVSEDELRLAILRERRQVYERELGRLAAQAGCAGRTGYVSEGPILAEMNDLSEGEAASIVRTYNADLARSISAIRSETPTANRYVYAKRLGAWDAARSEWKSKQVGMWVRGSAIGAAQRDFLKYNGFQEAKARMVPRVGVCPICQELIAMGDVPLEVVEANPTPIHANCPHTWEIVRGMDAAPDDCRELWMGM